MDAPPVQYVETRDGYMLAYCVAGEGVPFVYLPGPISHIHLFWRTPGAFRMLYERLAARFNLITYDSRGMGSSTRYLKPTHRSVDFEIDLETIVEHLGLQHFVLMAQSNFGRVAMNYAARNPARVMALVLRNTDIGDDPSDTSFKPDMMETLASSNWELYLETTVRTGWRPEDPAVAKRLVREAITQSDWLVRTRAWHSYSAREAVETLRLPMLLISSGTGALQSTEQVSSYIASRIPGARLAIFDDDGGGLFSRTPELPPAIPLIEDIVREASEHVATEPADQTPDGLSHREIEVLRLLASGKSNQAIADELVISLNTVRRHVSNIFDKTGSANRAQAAVSLSRSRLRLNTQDHC